MLCTATSNTLEYPNTDDVLPRAERQYRSMQEMMANIRAHKDHHKVFVGQDGKYCVILSPHSGFVTNGLTPAGEVGDWRKHMELDGRNLYLAD